MSPLPALFILYSLQEEVKTVGYLAITLKVARRNRALHTFYFSLVARVLL